MENTTGNYTNIIFDEPSWLTNAVTDSCLLVIGIYVFTALLIHELKVEKKRKKRFCNLSSELKYAVISKHTCMLVALISLIRQLTAIGSLWSERQVALFGFKEEHVRKAEVTCQVLSRVEIITLTLGMGFVYFYLWLRQRIFYVHPSLKMLNNKIVKSISVAIAIVWCVYMAPVLIFYLMFVSYHFKSGFCQVDDNSTNSYLKLLLSWALISILMQLALLGLFVYPILRQKRSKPSLIHRVKKALILTVISLVTDVSALTLTYVFYRTNAITIFLLYSLDLLVNHLVTIFCFDHWKAMLWPWTKINQEKTKVHCSVTSTQVF